MFAAGDFEASASFAWSRALFDHALEAGDRFFVIRLAANGRVRALLPVVIRQHKGLSRINSDLMVISELYGTHSDMLIAEPGDAVSKALLDAFGQLGKGWDRFVASRFVDSNKRYMALRHYLDGGQHIYHERNQSPTYYVPLNGPAESFIDSRSPNLKRNLTKARNRLRKAGKFEIVDFHHFQSSDEAFDALLAIEKLSWKHAAGTAISSTQKQTGFFRQLCNDASTRDELHLIFLLLDGRPIAYDLGLILGSRYSYLKTSFDETFKSLSPSSTLRAHLMTDLISRGVSELDFTAEPYEWQKRWTNQKREHCTLIVYNSTLRARVLERVSATRDALTGR